jgi:3-hydroxyisobutyrate dehydrogenase-like beta-hydroxyacid dehydrogenase
MQVVLAYKNFAANRAISHIGLGVTALNTAKSLRSAGIAADVWPIVSAAELRAGLRANTATHVVI